MERSFRITGTFDVSIEPSERAVKGLDVPSGGETGIIEPERREPEASSTAVVRFGDPGDVAPFPAGPEPGAEPPPGMQPERVFIARGGSVTFEIAPYHQVAIYRPGITPSDIDVSPERLEDATFGPFAITDFRINDPRGRVQLGPPQSAGRQTWTTPAGTFDEPGQYLVICTSTPHFVFGQLEGWIVVV